MLSARSALVLSLLAIMPAALPVLAADLNDCSEATLKTKNAETYVQLKKAGDIAERMRPTSFFFFGEAANITKIGKVLGENGFVLGEPSDAGQAVIAATNASMVPDVFDQLTIKVCITANKAAVNYDGWETVVVKK